MAMPMRLATSIRIPVSYNVNAGRGRPAGRTISVRRSSPAAGQTKNELDGLCADRVAMLPHRCWTVITGGGTGIGAALAERLARGGHRVLVVGRRLAPLQDTANRAVGELVRPVVADISTPGGRRAVAAALPPDAVVNYLVQNAAVGLPSRLADLREEDFAAALAVNVTGPVFLVQTLLPRLRPGSRVLHIGTGLAHGPEAQLGAISYSVSFSEHSKLL